MTAESETFLSRWLRIKNEARRSEMSESAADGSEAHRSETVRDETLRNETHRNEAAAVPVTGNVTEADGAAPPVQATPDAGAKPPEDLPAVASLDGLSSDYRGFLRPGVDDSLRRDALKRLFADPHFNTIDLFEAYSGDYTQGEPIDAAMMRTLEHARGLLFDEPNGPGGGRAEPSARVEQAAVSTARPEGASAPVLQPGRDGESDAVQDANAPVANGVAATTGIASPGIANKD